MENEIWINIDKDNCKKMYAVSNMGNVKNIITGRILSKSLRDGYYSVSIMNTKNSVSHKENIHILVAEHFIKKRATNEVINHINNNKLDNRIDNLEIITSKENTKKAIENHKYFSAKPINVFDLNGKFIEQVKNAKEASEKYDLHAQSISKICRNIIDPKTHIFKYPSEFTKKSINFKLGNKYKIICCDEIQGYVASIDGKIINAKTKQILKPTITNNGYYRISLKKRPFLVHRLIALTFIKNDDPVNKILVNHKDKSKQNNNVYNLEWITNSENIIHSKSKSKTELAAATTKQ